MRSEEKDQEMARLLRDRSRKALRVAGLIELAIIKSGHLTELLWPVIDDLKTVAISLESTAVYLEEKPPEIQAKEKKARKKKKSAKNVSG